ncbi:enoyl-CoA hydratase/isomerase family protein [Pseudomaricurvus sp. HS19]|uniref:enoyl-CoA hydratase/isomerase family protein n=1 Tax=Pseudomaricurvus sp. HS19 TaxID=2692626 RepID=UPI00136D5CF5|nr:enoyl-CoA hydratase/isomerase family protein [Pseudomaricurvus sp. HS19]MYM62429.1 gamma-carboxygeranoyl-CoA hydratase [Pseudomaricurvus sp. HS19]
MTEQTIRTHIDGRGVATVTMSRPDKHNAFDDGVIAELTNAFQALAENPQVRIMILAAEGKSFSAGADLGWMQRMANYSYDENLRDANALANMLKTLNTLPFPTIARVQGAAFGGAVGLVSCCDMAVAAPKASFCLSEVKIGLIPATISPYVMAAIGQRACRRYFMTAERFSAETAAQLGLVSELVDAEILDSRIDELVNTLLANSPAAIRAAKRLVLDIENRVLTDDLIADSSERIATIRVSGEGQEGLNAFLEKRPASWING